MDKVVEERFKALQKALKIQAKEYERRLRDLNGEAKRIASIQNQSVTKELFDSTIATFEKSDYIPREIFDRALGNMAEKSDARYKEILAAIKDISDWKKSQEGSKQNRGDILKYIPILISIILFLLYLYALIKK